MCRSLKVKLTFYLRFCSDAIIQIIFQKLYEYVFWSLKAKNDVGSTQCRRPVDGNLAGYSDQVPRLQLGQDVHGRAGPGGRRHDGVAR